MKFRNCYVSNCASGVTLLATVLPSAVCRAEPDSSQFGFLSSGGRSESLRTGIRRSGTLITDGTDGSDTADVRGQGAWDVWPEWLHLDLTVQSIYDDNIFLTAEDRKADWLTRVTPSFRASSGAPASATWVVDGIYAPTWTGYASSTLPNSFDHAGSATLHYNGRRLKGSSALSYQETTGNDRFARDLLKTTATQADVSLAYELTGKTSLEARLMWQNLERVGDGVQTFNNEETLSVQVSALWQATGKTTVGPSVRAGATSSTLSPDRTFVDLLLRGSYESTGKLSFSGEAGVQYISYDEGGGSTWAPSASVSGRYTVNSSWQLLVNAYSRNTPSLDLANSNLQATGINGLLSWNPGSRFRVSAGAGYESTRHELLAGGAVNSDDYTYGELRAGLRKEGSPLTLDVFYRHRLTASSDPGRDFENDQAGVSLGFRF